MTAKDRTDAKNRHEENAKGREKSHRLNIFIAIVATLTLAVASIGAYLQYTQSKLEKEVEGMDEHEICQYALKNYGMKTVEEIGCTDASTVK